MQKDFFVKSGILRFCYFNDHVEITAHFAMDYSVIGAVDSIIKETKSHEYFCKKMLLLDRFGALATATFLSQVLARFESFFGIPKGGTFYINERCSMFCSFFNNKPFSCKKQC